MRKSAVTIIIACLSVAAAAQASSAAYSPEALPGVEIGRSRTFTAESLYGYMNGGAELYLEYGFDTLIVTELTCKDKDIKVEFYRMKDAEAAFGIFSVSRFRCNGGPRLTEHTCRSSYQMQFCKGRFYVSIINDTGTEAEQKSADMIASHLLEQISDTSFDPGRFFDDGVDAETMKSAMLIRGPLGIYNGIPDLIDALGSATDYSALVIRKEQQTRASVLFNTESAASDFMKSQKMSDPQDSVAMDNHPAVSLISSHHIIIEF